MRLSYGRMMLNGAAILAFLLLVCHPLDAATWIQAPDGATLRVWEVGDDGSPSTLPGHGRAILYEIDGADWNQVGILGPTADHTIDTAPTLVLDSRTGSPVALWSRSDGVFLKIAYARFEGGAWRDLHLLTFGSGNDVHPRVGTGSDGSTLFWIGKGNRIMHAPIDLTAGRLFAAPRRVPGVHARSPKSGLPPAVNGLGVDGGTDVPVIVERCLQNPGHPACHNPSPSRRSPWRQIAPEGGSDVPIIVDCSDPEDPLCDGANPPLPWQRRRIPEPDGGSDVPIVTDETSAPWFVVSEPTCPSQVVVFSDPEHHRTLFLFEFSGGEFDLLADILVPNTATPGFPLAAANLHLDDLCN